MNRRGIFVEFFITALVVLGVVILSVAILPLIPHWIVPQAMTVAVVATAIEENAPRAAAIGIWGGLLLDLAAPSRFGLLWIPLILLALAAVLLRGNATNDSPTFWPLWFVGAAVLCAAPFAIFVGAAVLQVIISIAATTVWGVMTVVIIRWIRSSRVSLNYKL